MASIVLVPARSAAPDAFGQRGPAVCPVYANQTFYSAVGFLAVKVGSRVARRRLRKALHRA